VLKMGIAKYNAECRAIVMRYSKEWEQTVTRIGRWISFENDYKTMHLSFMESVWWGFGQLHEKGLVYRGFKVMPYSCACNTPLSNFEVQQNYKDVDDPAVVCAFPLIDEPNTKFVAWTTTPWTLPSNLALCVHPTFEYVKVRDEATGVVYIIMAARLVQIYPGLGNPKKKKEAEKKFSIVGEPFLGAELKGKQYTPPFAYFEASRSKDGATGAFRVICGDFVTEDSGTGIVHCAPAFGEEDYKVCIAEGVVRKDNVDAFCPLDANGRFTETVPEFKGLFVKDADKGIIKLLKEKGRMVDVGVIKHSYPFCYRSDTPLIYRAVPSTFVNVESIKDRLVANNDQTYWVPDFVKEKRFKNWLENARDWAVSRNRFWGTPIPMWVSDDGKETVVIGSIEELEQLSGERVTDLHRESIDHIELESKEGRGKLKRIDEVFDCWFESGSMPYAQQHYPFENKEKFEASFPADFIAEGIDQTRGWFYTLMVLSTALFNKPPFKNLICNGLVQAEDGRKMSKRLKNYPEPTLILDRYGADALRLYLINSPVVRAEDLPFKEDGVKQVLKDVFLPWYHAYRLFVQSANTLEAQTGELFTRDEALALSSTNTMDRWILAAANSLCKYMRQEMEAYRLYTVVPRLVGAIELLTNWYIRMNKERFSGERGEEDRKLSLCTLFEVLLGLCCMMAPLTPFFTEHVYRNLRKVMPESPESVHFLMIPEVNEAAINEEIESDMAAMRQVIEKVRVIRDRHKLSMRTPLPSVTFIHKDQSALDAVVRLKEYIAEELNVREIHTALVSAVPDLVKFNCQPNHSALGKRFGKDYKNVQKQIMELGHEELAAFVSSGTMTVGGHAFGAEDIVVAIEFVGDKAQFDADACEGGLVTLDIKPTAAMLDEATAREVCAKIQKMRKDAGLRKEDKVEVTYAVGEGSHLGAVLASQADYIAKRINLTPLAAAQLPARAVPLATNETEVRVQTLDAEGKIDMRAELATLTLVRGCVWFHEGKLKKLVPDASTRDDVQNYVHCFDHAGLRTTYAAGGTLSLMLGEQKVQLVAGEHFFVSSGDALRAKAL